MDTFEAIKSRIDLVEYISNTVQLRKSGRIYEGLCPFHSEKTASFKVFPSKGDFHCYGCGAHGTVIDFVMLQENLSVWEAVEHLANNIGMVIDQDPEYAKRREEFKRREHAAETKHQEIYKAQDYLQQRKISQQTSEEFLLGWSDKNRSIVIPIHDKYGRTVGFSERFLNPGDGPKYKNSVNDEFFQKGEILYNLHRARKHMKNKLFIVEGYFDVMSLWEMGIQNVVGVNRDSLTSEQMKTLKDVLNEDITITLIPDRDQTGYKSVEKNTTLLRKFVKNHITVMSVPKGCKDANDALIQDIHIEHWQEVSADMYLLKMSLAIEKDKEKQYLIAKRIAEQAANDMVKADMVDYLSELWQKEKKLVREYLGAAQESSADRLSSLFTIDSLVDSYIDYVSKEDKYIVSLGYPKLNKYFRGGVRPGEVLQFIARSNVGKTTWLINVIMRVMAQQNIPVIFFSLEQQKEPIFEIMMQILHGYTDGDTKLLFKDGMFESLSKSLEPYRKNFLIVEQSGLTLKEMEELIHLADMHIFDQPCRAIFIDYMGYIKSHASGDYERTSEIAKELKELAKRTNKAVFSLHQTSRDGAGGWKPVNMTMARGSGVVEESADYLLGAWRPSLDPDLSEVEKEAIQNDYMIGILKNRRGPTNATMKFKYYPETRRIVE